MNNANTLTVAAVAGVIMYGGIGPAHAQFEGVEAFNCTFSDGVSVDLQAGAFVSQQSAGFRMVFAGFNLGEFEEEATVVSDTRVGTADILYGFLEDNPTISFVEFFYNQDAPDSKTLVSTTTIYGIDNVGGDFAAVHSLHATADGQLPAGQFVGWCKALSSVVGEEGDLE